MLANGFAGFGVEPRPSRSVARRAPSLGVVFLLVPLLGCFDFSGSGSGSKGSEAEAAPVPAPAPPPDTPSQLPPEMQGDPGLQAFGNTVYPVVSMNCGPSCHVGGGRPGTPFIAHPDMATAYAAVLDNQKVTLQEPGASRLVRRLSPDRHNCWSGSCEADAMLMQMQVAAWAQLLAEDPGGEMEEEVDQIASAALDLDDGIEQAGGGRTINNLVALWEFKEGAGGSAADTSGVAPAMDLELVGPQWMSNYGIAIESGKAQASVVASRKLFDRIAAEGSGSQQYSIEAWVTPANVTQEGPARIVSYSQGTGERNFTLGQVLYNYDFRNRTANADIGANGTPSLQTNDNDEDLQATLQHVVVTYDQAQGRRIYVNGRFTDDVDAFAPDSLSNWNPGYRFLLANETTDDRQWQGRIRLAAIYERALSEAQILQNYEAGVGKRLSLRFDLAGWLQSGGSIEFEVIELDEYSYLFCRPVLMTSEPGGIRVKSPRVSVSGRVAVSGQAFTNVDRVVRNGEQISDTCSIVPKGPGPAPDQFVIEFEALDRFENPIASGAPSALPPEMFPEPMPGLGVRDFARLRDTMSEITGVDPNTPSVLAAMADLEQQLPSGPDLRSFSSSHQVGIAKLALEYCDTLIEMPLLRAMFFGMNSGFDFDAPATTAFTPAMRNLLIGQLVDGILGERVASQPDTTELAPILHDLFDDLTAGCTPATCGAERTRSVVKSACAALMGSTAVSVH